MAAWSFSSKGSPPRHPTTKLPRFKIPLFFGILKGWCWASESRKKGRLFPWGFETWEILVGVGGLGSYGIFRRKSKFGNLKIFWMEKESWLHGGFKIFVICINIVSESDFTDPMHHWCLLCFVVLVFALKIEGWWTHVDKKNVWKEVKPARQKLLLSFFEDGFVCQKSGRHLLGNPGSRWIRIILSHQNLVTSLKTRMSGFHRNHQVVHSQKRVRWIQILASRGRKRKLAFWEGEKITWILQDLWGKWMG